MLTCTPPPGPPCCRAPASCAPCVPEAQGSWCATARTLYAYQSAVRTAYRGTTGNMGAVVIGSVVAHVAELKLRHSYTETVQEKRRRAEEKRLLLERNELLHAIRRGLQDQAELRHPAGDTDSSEAGPSSGRNSGTPSLPPGPPSSTSGRSSRETSPPPTPPPGAEIDQQRLLAEHTETESSDVALEVTATLLTDDTGIERHDLALAVSATSPKPELAEPCPFVPFGAMVAYGSVAHSQQAALQPGEAAPLERQWSGSGEAAPLQRQWSGSGEAAPLPLIAYAMPVAPAGATWPAPGPFPAPPRATSFVPPRRPATPTATPSAKRVYSNPYVIFCQEQRPFLPTGLRNAERERYLGQMWKALPEEERSRFKGRAVSAPDAAPSMEPIVKLEPIVRQSSGPLTAGQPAMLPPLASAFSSSASSSSSSVYSYATPLSWPVSSLPSPPPSSLPSATLLALVPNRPAAPTSFMRAPTGTPLMRAPSPPAMSSPLMSTEPADQQLMGLTTGRELQLAELLELMTEEEAMEVVEQDALDMLKRGDA